MFKTTLLILFLLIGCASDTISQNSESEEAVLLESGTLRFTFTTENFEAFHGDPSDGYTSPETLPSFEINIFTFENRVIVDEHFIRTEHPDWNIIVQHGYQTELGYEFPFALVERNQNCTHNGVMTLQGSQVSAHINTETCAYFQFNLTANGNVQLSESSLPNEAELLAEFEHQSEETIQREPLDSLPIELRQSLSALAGKTVYGLYWQGTHYQSHCAARDGNYSYCPDIILPSYSLAKGLVAGLTTFRLQQRYGDDFLETPVHELVPECLPNDWQNVTLNHLANMQTGRFDSMEYMADENAAKTIEQFFIPDTHVDKLDFACGYPEQETPGQTFVYHTSDTYLLSTALQNLYQQQTGNHGSYYQNVLVEDIFKPLGLSSLSQIYTASIDQPNVPYAGYGHFFTPNDIVKLAQFIWLDQGEISESSLLSTELASQPLNQRIYQHGFWFYSFGDYQYCEQDVTIPYLSGYGGNIIAALPNDMILYFAGDDFEFAFADIVKELLEATPCNS